MLKTRFEEIVDVSAIGTNKNPISLNEVLAKAAQEKLLDSAIPNDRVALLVIDMQNDFMEGGSLGVSGSAKDVENLTK